VKAAILLSGQAGVQRDRDSGRKFESGASKNKKFWKELICLLSLQYLKMSFALKPAFAPT
jgi:hypothetical protein